MLALRETDPRQVGGYRLFGRLGEGGQGVVFLAEGPDGRQVAVKLLPPTTDPQVRSRFLKEVAAAARVPRSCTAQVVDAGIFERRPYIVSEFVSGPSLVEVIEQLGSCSGAALERIAVATLTALGAVHAAGMVHRDFKPGNVLLGPDGPVVIDFGLAAVPGMTTTAVSGLVAFGTPAFMAPEQLAGDRVTAPADMWAWAVTMAFAGTGEMPFRGESLTATAYAIIHSEPRLDPLPEPLGSLIRRCLSKEPAARPSARDALAEMIATGARSEGPMPPVAAARPIGMSVPDTYRAPSALLELPDSGDAGSAFRRHSARRRRKSATRRRGAMLVLAALVLAGGAGALVMMVPRHGSPSARLADSNATVNPNAGNISRELAAEGAARTAAITWIMQQVNRAAVVACDSQVCADLANDGFPPANLLTLGPGSADPLGSDLVVATAPIRAQYGGRLASVYAPAVIASFGSGAAEIDIRLVPAGGAASYWSDEQTALRARKAAGAELLANDQLRFSPAARAQLLSGEVDPRLPELLAAMAAVHPVRVVDFVDRAHGGGPASLLRWVDLAVADRAATLTGSAYLNWMQGFLDTQQSDYRPEWIQRVTSGSGEAVLRIGYGAPSPLS